MITITLQKLNDILRKVGLLLIIIWDDGETPTNFKLTLTTVSDYELNYTKKNT